ncbi:MAG: hypothetical protein JO166_01170 [Deltaproteobacteria bacterium]|nr:hypothetical protein [Deltaproteobacteria bacterium]
MDYGEAIERPPAVEPGIRIPGPLGRRPAVEAQRHLTEKYVIKPVI